MATKAARGTKRTCQSSECGERFYDLNREPIVCPICQTVYRIASAPLVAEAAPEPVKPSKEFADTEALAPGDAPEVETEALEDLETGDDDVAAEADETFLEEEEDGGDVTGIIGTGVADGDDEG